ncbi:MHO_1580 family protein [Metamycoplasma neophronis]|uniref:Uncharacterized protein n=1 Tax=Metamycoplasma neophronis TaxID=872983 RepID=A0ABY2Z0Q6_9BACT|nr:hypothetical protein [Metamycoplasma neophronis]TPR54098.1 hypothetical protein FJR74_01495 [Metamycoplasma neophronis]
MLITANASEIKRDFWVENYYVKAERYQYLLNWSNINQYAKLQLRRLIKNNKYILELSYANFNRQIQDIKIRALINNKPIEFNHSINPETNHHVFSLINELNKDSNSINFEDIENINFEIFYQVNKTWYQVERLTYFINKIKNNTTLKTNGEPININLITKIIIESFPDFNDHKLMRHFENREYLSFQFKPAVLEQGLHNKKLFDFEILKISSDGQSTHFIEQSDISNLSIKLKISNTGIQGDYDVIYNPWDNQKSILVDSYSFWDKTLQKTIVSPNNMQAKRGLLIPLNFSGNFFSEILLNFGEKIKNFSVVNNQYIERPFFNSIDGLIKLKTKKINGYINGQYNKIKVQNIRSIMDNAKTIDEINYWGSV